MFTKHCWKLYKKLNNLEYIVIEEPSLDETLRSIEQVKLVENPVDQSQPNISVDRKQKKAEIEYDSIMESELNDANMLDQNIDIKNEYVPKVIVKEVSSGGDSFTSESVVFDSSIDDFKVIFHAITFVIFKLE